MTVESIDQVRESILSGERSVRETVAETLARAKRANEALDAFHSIEDENALSRAEALDRALSDGAEPGPLFGVPVALKANLCLKGAEVNCGSRVLAGYRPPYTATAVERLCAAGAVPVGMTHMDEFGMGSSGENSAYRHARNPWDPSRTPGGSSSGSAVAVAAGLVPLALGSDTGGSVRQPAAFCGLVGFKPTYGRVSRYGLVAFGSSLDQISPLTRSAEDAQRVAAVLSGHDPRDATSIEQAPLPAPEEAPRSLAGARIGLPKEYLPAGLAPGMRAGIERALEVLREAGAEIVPVELPHTEYAIAAYYVIATAEASSNLARYDGVRFGIRKDGDGSLQGMIAATREAGFGREVKRRILLGTYVLSSGYYEAWYGQAQKVRARITQDFSVAFDEVDLIAGPTTPTAAFSLGEKAADPVAMYQSDVLTVPASLAGLPAVSVPCGFTREETRELPLGLQLIGPRLADDRVLNAARVFQERTDYHAKSAPAEAWEGGSR